MSGILKKSDCKIYLMPQLVRAFRHRNYRLFFSGQLISLVGTWLPLTLAALTLSGHVRVWHIFVLATCLGIVNAFDIPARQSFVVEMVGRGDLMNAIALNSAMVNGARVLGPSIAGMVIAVVGEGWCFLLNGLSYIAVIAGLLMMTVVRAGPHHSGSAARGIVDGFRFVLQTVPVRTVLLLVGVVSFFGLPYVVLMPVFAEAILHQGPRGLGLLMGASGLGALGGALTLAARSGVRGLGRWVAVSATAFGIALGLFSLSRTFWLSAVLLVPVGASMMVQMASSNTLLQAMVPDALRGRVMSVYSMMLMGMAPMGALLAGAAAARIGAPYTVAIGGAVCVISAAVFATRLPHFRAEARQLIATQGLGPPL